ncbi:MAG: DUF1778 domain-containing protein [Treponema sp.]|nr:DUF1778 domain-containing protein [Treponema sp.]
MENETPQKPKYVGYGYHGGGRPKGSTKAPELSKNTQLYVRITQEQKAQIDEAAKAAGLTTSAYVLQKLFS